MHELYRVILISVTLSMAEGGSSLLMKEDALKAKRKFITLCRGKH